MELDTKEACLRALEIYARHRNLDFPDALIVGNLEVAGLTEVYSYDRDWDRIDGVTRVEP